MSNNTAIFLVVLVCDQGKAHQQGIQAGVPISELGNQRSRVVPKGMKQDAVCYSEEKLWVVSRW